MVGLTSTLPPERLLAVVEDLLRTMPTFKELQGDPHTEWFGSASALVAAWDGIQGTVFDAAVRKLFSGETMGYDQALWTVQTTLNRARYDLLLHTADTGTKVVAKGDRFHYFDEVRKIIERGRSDLLFVDPYLAADFAARYLPHVHAGTKVRLLGREKLGKLLPAVELMREQFGLSIEVRSASGFHDRYLLIDGRECYQSGASFEDGARLSPTTLTPVLDAFGAVSQICEALWAGGAPK